VSLELIGKFYLACVSARSHAWVFKSEIRPFFHSLNAYSVCFNDSNFAKSDLNCQRGGGEIKTVPSPVASRNTGAGQSALINRGLFRVMRYLIHYFGPLHCQQSYRISLGLLCASTVFRSMLDQ
jgi:hypothetical protein